MEAAVDRRGVALHLPHVPGHLIGRSDEVDQVCERIAGTTRLLTLIGPGGAGKTRLAIAAAERLAEQHAAIAFVDLTAVSDPTMVPAAIAHAVDASGSATLGPMDALEQHLHRQAWTLVLDNFEHLLPAGRDVAALLANCPSLRIVVTSRAPLGIRWEHLFEVPPLGTPDLANLPAAEDLAQTASVALFLERARAVRPELRLTESNSRDVAEICVRLEGLPLAIELAAARARLLSPREIVQRLGRRLDLLTTGPADAPARHRTLREAIAWSVALLEPAERALFRQLSVFANGCTLEAIDAVAQVNEEPLDLLARLVDRSLVQVDDVDGQSRYRLLETLRQFGEEELRQNGELPEAQQRHRGWYLNLALEAQQEMGRPDQHLWLDRLELEHDNLRFALKAALRDAPDEAARMATAMARFWELRGYLAEGRRWIEEATAREGIDPAVRGRALNRAAALASRQGDYRGAIAFYERAQSLFETAGDTAGLAETLQGLSMQLDSVGETERAQALMETTLGLFRAIGDIRGQAGVLNNIGYQALLHGQLERAGPVLEQSVQLWQQVGDRNYLALARYNLGKLACLQSDFPRARQLLTEALVEFRVLGHQRMTAFGHYQLAELARLEGDNGGAREGFQRALATLREMGEQSGTVWCLEALAQLATVDRQHDSAVRLWGAADALRTRIGEVLNTDQIAVREQALGQARDALGDNLVLLAWTEGQVEPLDEVLRQVASSPGSAKGSTVAAPAKTVLSTREWEVARLIADGRTDTEIAEVLVISRRTAENHTRHILAKLGFRSRWQVAIWARDYA